MQKIQGKKSIFISGLPKKVTESEITNFFSKFGNIERAKLKLINNKTNCAGYGFLECKDKATFDNICQIRKFELKKDVKITAEINFKGETLKIYKENLEMRKVYVIGIPQSAKDEEIKAVFEEQVGAVERAYTVKGRSRESKHYGFVIFEEVETALKALEMKKVKFKRYKLSCKKFEKKKRSKARSESRTVGKTGGAGGRSASLTFETNNLGENEDFLKLKGKMKNSLIVKNKKSKGKNGRNETLSKLPKIQEKSEKSSSSKSNPSPLLKKRPKNKNPKNYNLDLLEDFVLSEDEVNIHTPPQRPENIQNSNEETKSENSPEIDHELHSRCTECCPNYIRPATPTSSVEAEGGQSPDSPVGLGRIMLDNEFITKKLGISEVLEDPVSLEISNRRYGAYGGRGRRRDFWFGNYRRNLGFEGWRREIRYNVGTEAWRAKPRAPERMSPGVVEIELGKMDETQFFDF
jgi:RNA recognition motif-containing protein